MRTIFILGIVIVLVIFIAVVAGGSTVAYRYSNKKVTIVVAAKTPMLGVNDGLSHTFVSSGKRDGVLYEVNQTGTVQYALLVVQSIMIAVTATNGVLDANITNSLCSAQNICGTMCTPNLNPLEQYIVGTFNGVITVNGTAQPLTKWTTSTTNTNANTCPWTNISVSIA